MQNVSVKDIVLASEGELLSGDPGEQILHMTTDSREIPASALFVPISGANLDAHRFIPAAVKNGARAVISANREICEQVLGEAPDCGTAFILVNDTTDAVQKIARMARAKLSLPAVGVTGSVGKTTTREMIAAALSAEKKVFKTNKNFNNWLGVPITLCEMSDDFDIAVLELGLNVRGELGLISSLSNLDAAVITNIGVAHIEFYGTREEICKEKFTITRGFRPENPGERCLILNGNDALLTAYCDQAGYPYVLYGTMDNAAYKGENVRRENGKTVFDFVRYGERQFPVALSVPGEHNVLNALAALAAADRYGVDLKAAAEKIAEFNGFKNRLEQTEHNGYLVIDDTYNASPDSMKAGLDVLCSSDFGNGKGRKIAVLGDMFELGENAAAFHYEVGVYAAKKPLDLLFLTGEKAVGIGRAVEENGGSAKVLWFETKEELTKELLKTVRENDTVYLKASNGMKLKVVAEALKEQ